ncbi:calmodulin-binding protein, putative [Bodo saltans]|uniref:Calmodulin-binding protein, putative n=1 Tax=Bodo saltans TaxID=75058 RepID=A0A0S4JD23_BODSA|nr:calmodulin-binding protein, putative [Bodo saltans]|eukprot:CUG88039.1 calmodulin-binding protein, putative [Bodo saltans]
MKQRLAGESVFTPTRQYSARSDHGSSTPGGLSTSTAQGFGASSAASQHSDEIPLATTISANRFSSAKLQRQPTASSSDLILNISLGGGGGGNESRTVGAIGSGDPFSHFAFSSVATAPLDLVADGSPLDEYTHNGTLTKASSTRNSLKKPHPPAGASSATSGGPRLTIKALEARQVYQLRLVRHHEQQRRAAVATIIKFYRDQKQRRASRIAFRNAREAMIRENIKLHRRDMLRRKFRLLVSRHSRRSHNPTQHWRWVRLQAWVRGFLARKTFLKMRDVARHVHNFARIKLAQHQAAIVVQQYWKRFFVQRRLVNVSAYLAVRRSHAARVIQRSVRQYLFCRPAAEKWAVKTRYRHYRAASKIQRVWRAWRENFDQRLDATRTRLILSKTVS